MATGIPNGEPVGLFYAWWRGDALPLVPQPDGVELDPAPDERAVAALSGLDVAGLRSRAQRGHRPYIAHLDGEPVGIGWSAAVEASIGELGITMRMPPANRYLWDFVTPPRWRGRGIYPWLLQQILLHEAEVERFWVGHDLDNVASGRGIAKTGFQVVGEVYLLDDSRAVLVAQAGELDRARAAAALLGMPLGRD